MVFENRRWFDIRRWKILEQMIKDVKGIDIIETKQGNTITTTWQQIPIVSLGPVVEKMYWIPIDRDEINKAPWLEQNPGY